MGSTLIPLAASGQPASVLLVEVQTRPTPPPPDLGAPPPIGVGGIPAPAPGETVDWAIATSWVPGEEVADRFISHIPPPDYLAGTITSSTATTGSMYAAAGFLSTQTSACAWGGYSIPSGIDPARITHIYPVIKLMATGGLIALQCSPYSGIFTGISGVNVGSDLVSFGTSLGGVELGASVSQSLPGAPPSVDNSVGMQVSFVGFAIYHTTPPLGLSDSRGDANVALAAGQYFWSEHRAKWPSLLLGGAIAQFLDWLTGEQKIQIYGSVQTDMMTVHVQNTSGDTVDRDIAKAFVRTEFIGALFAARIWHGASESAELTFIGTVTEAEVDDNEMTLTVEGFGNWSAITAPSYNIDSACPLTFASPACGSTSPTPCDQTYGTCSQINRFAGVLAQWVIETPDVQIAQPVPNVSRNPARTF